MKRIYISPVTDVVQLKAEGLLNLLSNNDTSTGTGQEGTGETGNQTPGTGHDLTPGAGGGRNAKEFDLWDFSDNWDLWD